MRNPPLIIVFILVSALATLSIMRQPGANESARFARFGGLLPMGAERFPTLPPAPGALNGANAWLAINGRGLDIIRESEGLRLDAYFLAGQWLVGYGHAGTAREGMTITAVEADALLLADVKDAEDAVRRLVVVPVNENEFSALVSLSYNMGSAAFANTLVLKRLNKGDRAGAADSLGYLVSADINGERVELDALVRRRAHERALFLAPPLRT